MTRLASVGDAGPKGLTLNAIQQPVASGNSIQYELDYGGYALRQFVVFDGRTKKIVLSNDESLLVDTPFNNPNWGEFGLSATGTAHGIAAGGDNSLGVYAIKPDGTVKAVATTKEALPGGEWVIYPFALNVSLNGEVYFGMGKSILRRESG